MSSVLHIVPRLPPAIDGLGDYAVQLSDCLATQGLTSRFLVTDPTWKPDGTLPASVLREPSAAALIAALAGQQHVLLHFVNYAYEPRKGCPHWLIDGLQQWRGQAKDRRFVVMFHELFAMGWPWRKAFWYSAAQRSISAALARLADACWTSNQVYAKWLTNILGRAIPMMPVLSNMGEPETLIPWSQRLPAMVVFGRAVNRQRAYDQLGDHLIALARSCGIRELHDVGAPLSRPIQLPGLTTVTHGILPTAALSALLMRCSIGVIHNQGSPLAKSGVVAAYTAHGMAIACETQQSVHDGLVPGYNLIDLERMADGSSLRSIAEHGHHWYHQHNRQRLGELVAPWFHHLTQSH